MRFVCWLPNITSFSEYAILVFIAFLLQQACANAPQYAYYVMRMLPALLKIVSQDYQFVSAQTLLQENDNLEYVTHT
jgi:hypothetical protein